MYPMPMNVAQQLVADRSTRYAEVATRRRSRRSFRRRTYTPNTAILSRPPSTGVEALGTDRRETAAAFSVA
ncbi:MAG: hypothetical protein JWL83_2336 [Actinomycetia bacterium]|nr:hypothetical protein [Actinomycetes bacterium]